VIIDRDGNRHWGAYAVRYLTRRLRRLWWALPLAYFPGSMLLWRPLYRWIARNRYRLSGAKCDEGTCELHR
jgi:predicted DCC family thiol-disulfide oxidoreductase YuxK